MNDPLASPQDFEYLTQAPPVNYQADSSGPSIKIYPPPPPSEGDLAELQPGEVATPIRVEKRGGGPSRISVPTEIRFREYTLPDTEPIPKTAQQREQSRKNEVTMAKHPLVSDEGGVHAAVAKLRRGMMQDSVPTYHIPKEAWQTPKQLPPAGMIFVGALGFISIAVLIFLLTRYMNSPAEVVTNVVKKAAKKGVLHAERAGKLGKSIAK